MSERFFVAQPIIADHVTLDGPEAHHLLHVMRATTGDEITLFDGSGAEFSGVIDSVARSQVEVRVLTRHEVDCELPFLLTVAVALPKGDRQKWLIEKLTELGVATLVPLVTERGVAQPVDAALDRLRRAVVEAAKQCGRNRLMQIAEPVSWHNWLNQAADLSAATRRLVAHPGGEPIGRLEIAQRRPTSIAIGPEGGFSDGEVALAIGAGWQAVDLGSRILRVETAAVALTAALSFR